MYSSNNKINSSSHEEELDFKDMLTTLERYKLSIIIIIVLALFFAVIYAYMSTNMYRASLTMQIQPQPESGVTNDDMLAEALSGQKVNIENEIVIMKSNFVIQKALENVPMEIRYFFRNQFKTQELYKDTPFTVDCKSVSESLIQYKFQLHPVDDTRFRLTIEPSFMMKLLGQLNGEKLIYFSQVYTYGVAVHAPMFSMTINKNRNIEKKDYFFTIVPNKRMIKLVQSSFVVSAATDKGSVLELTYEDNSKERAEDMLDAIAHAYQSQNIEKKSASAQKTLNFIDKQLLAINQNLQNSANNLKNYKTQHIVTVDLKDKALMATQKLSELEKQRDDLEMQEGVYKNLLINIQDANSVSDIDPGASAIVGSPLMLLIQKLQEATTARVTLLVDYTDKHPSVIKVNQQINSLKSNIKRSVESNLNTIQQRKKILDGIIQQNNGTLAEIPEEEKQLSKIANGLEVNQKVYEYLLQKRAETTILVSSTVSGDQIIDSALVEKVPVKPNQGLIIMLGILLGLIVGLSQALIRNALSATIQSLSDVEKRTTLPIVTVLPYFNNKKSLYQDALRVLLTRFEYGQEEEKPKIITFTSSVWGEGRTTTAIELGQVMAQSGKKVIILDIDMRQSSIHTKFNMENSKGITTYLNRKDEFSDVIHHAEQNNLDFICSGSDIANPYDMIMSEDFKNLLSKLKESYDYVLLIAPPAGMVADALVLMRLSDLNLVLFRAEYSKKDFVETIDRFVKEHNFKNVGIVLNSLELKKIRRWY